jgi:hypothetical protein
MDRAGYTAMTGELCDRLASDGRVVGLVALGSMAELTTSRTAGPTMTSS